MTVTQINILKTLFAEGAMSTYSLIHTSKARHFYTSPSGIRTRLNELVKRGHVHAVGVESTPSGRKAQTWDLTDQGFFAAMVG
jgi:predicted ArsR family transcriptional regulator